MPGHFAPPSLPIALAILLGPVTLGVAQDRLQPVTGPFSQYDEVLEYHLQVRKLLLDKPSEQHLARVVCLPAFAPEWTVTIVGNEEDGYLLKDAEVAGDKPVDLINEVAPTVERREVPIDKTTAHSLHFVWRSMLLLSEYPAGSSPKAIADGTSYHFSCFHPAYGVLEGQVYTPEVEDSATRTLADLGWMLHQFAKAPEDERGTRVKEIRAKIDEIMRFL